MFKPPLLLTLSYLVSMAAYHVGNCFLLGQRERSVEPGPPTLRVHGALIGAGSFGVATYWVMMRRTPRTPDSLDLHRWSSTEASSDRGGNDASRNMRK